MPEELERELLRWLVDQGLDSVDETGLLAGLCERLQTAGLSLRRAYVASEVLHPLHDARGLVWRPEAFGREDYGYESAAARAADWRNSPLYHIIERKLPRLRLRLDGGLEAGRFPLLHRLRDEGCTDYLALARAFPEGAAWGGFKGVVASFATARSGGFRDAEIRLLGRLMAPLALALKTMTVQGSGETLMRTYLGRDAGRRVIAGEIRRGEPQAIEAVLWFSDLQGFTRLADTVEPRILMALLNTCAERLVTAIEAEGGDVLKFMGDGILALFHGDEPEVPCAAALRAAIEARSAVAAANAERTAAGLPVTDFYLGLHRGTVLYGNIGSRDRLDFTVIGPAVNEVARIEQMCRSLDQRLVTSEAFARSCGPERQRLVSLGRYALRGVGRAQELFTLDPEAAGEFSQRA